MMDANENITDFFIIESSDSTNIILLNGPVFISKSEEFTKINQYIDITKNIIIDCKNLTEYDSFFIILVNQISQFAANNEVSFELINVNKDLQSFYDLLKTENISDKQQEKEKHAFVRYAIYIGNEVSALKKDAYLFISFLGELIVKTFTLFIKPKEIRWKDFPSHFTKSGVNAIPITVMIMFLIGIITGYQGALQLKQFGADIYIADLIGVSLTRELTPLMVAILVAGRSGSSFAAELGTMKVSEEIDALESMGFDSIKFLVLPRVLAVTFAMPILVMICNIVGIGGGLVAALSTLDVTISGYINELQLVLNFYDVFSGVFKSIIFGFMIATVGCYRGLQVKGGAESVGKFTTASVVTGVFLIIFVDALFVFVLQALGI